MTASGKISVNKIALSAGLLVFMVYLSALNCGFINYDDPHFVTDNPAIHHLDADFIKWSFTSSHAGWWMPLVWISFAVDYHFWQLNPLGYHLLNNLLHAINTAIVVLIADILYRRVFAGLAAITGDNKVYCGMLLFAGLVFGMHPLQVESVAWVSERKNVLNAVFTLGSILFYLRYVERKMTAGAQPAGNYYRASLACMLLALLTKPVSVFIPCLLLILDWYPLDRSKSGRVLAVLVEKIPYLLLAVTLAIGTILSASSENVLVPLSTYSLVDRFISSGAAVFDYVTLLIWPTGVVLFYLLPYPLPLSFLVKAAVVAGFTLYCLTMWRKKPWLPATWCCFLLPLIPSLHFFLNGAQSICSHFVYLPSVMPGILFAAAGAVAYVNCAGKAARYPKVLLMLLCLALLAFYFYMGQKYIATWKNSGTLWSRVIELQPIGRAYYYRGEYFQEIGNYSAAADDFEASIKMAETAGHPEIYTLHAFRGEALRKGGRYAEAVAEFSTAISMAPLPNFYYYRSLALSALGRSAEAEADLLRSGGEKGPIVWQYLVNRDDLKLRQGR